MKRILPVVVLVIGVCVTLAYRAPLARTTQTVSPTAPTPESDSGIKLQPAADRGRAAQVAPNSWTILVYLHSDHNLEESAIVDLEEMEQVGSGKGFNVIVQWDRLSEDGVSRIKVGRGEEASQVLEELPELDSDDPQTLADFIDWGLRKFPAQRYGLILWDHGAQWYGFGGDETTNAGDIMDLFETRDALKTSMDANKLAKFDFLAFDTCLMGGLEPLLQFADLTRLYIANPEIDYGDGWEYGKTFAFLKANPGISLTEFAKREASIWKDHHNSGESDLNNRAHVAYDTGKVVALTQAVQDFSQALVNTWDSGSETLAIERGRTVEYDQDGEDPHAPHDYVDIGDYAVRVAQKNPNLKPSAEKLNAAIDSMVIAKVLGRSNAQARGLSVWMPSDQSDQPSDDVIADYQDLPSSTASKWGGFMGVWLGTVNANNEAPQIQVLEQRNLQNPTPSALAQVRFDVKDKDLDTVYASLWRNDGPDLYSSYGDFFFKAAQPGTQTVQWDGTLWSVNDGKTTDFFPGFFQDPNDPLLYANAKFTPKSGKAFPVIVALDPKNKRLVAALDDSGKSPRKVTPEPGGVLEFQYLQYNAKTDKNTTVPTGARLTVPAAGLSALKVAKTRLKPGEYSLSLGAVDWAGNDNYEEVTITLR